MSKKLKNQEKRAIISDNKFGDCHSCDQSKKLEEKNAEFNNLEKKIKELETIKQELEKRTFPVRCELCDNPQPIARLPYDLRGSLQITCPHCGTEIVIFAIDLDTPNYKNIANA